MLKQLRHDLATNPVRYHTLLLLFLLVYFGEVILARLVGTVSSPERKFWLFYLGAVLLQLIPYRFILGITWLGGLLLAAAVYLRPEMTAIYDLSVWLMLTVVATWLAALVAGRSNDH